MSNINIIKTGHNTFTFTADSIIEVTMRKTAMGWNIEATEINHWDDAQNTTFFWVATTAREAVTDCHHALRYVERRRAIGCAVSVRKWN